MLADLDLLLIAVFCTADDLLPEPAKNARRILTDAEVVTLCVAQAIMGITSDARFLKGARKQLAHLFPLLPNRTRLPEASRAAQRHDRGADGRVRERQPRLPRRPGAGRLDPGRVRPQHRDNPAQPARRRRRLRLLRQPQPLLLGLPPARPVRPGRHPTRAAAHLAQDTRTRGLPHAAPTLPTRRAPVRDRRQRLRRPRVRTARRQTRRHDRPAPPQRRTRPAAPTSRRSGNGSNRSSRPAKTCSPSNATAPAPSTASEPASEYASSPSPPRSASTTASAAHHAPSSTTPPEPVELLI